MNETFALMLCGDGGRCVSVLGCVVVATFVRVVGQSRRDTGADAEGEELHKEGHTVVEEEMRGDK